MALERQAWTALKQFPTRSDMAIRASAMRGRVAALGLHVLCLRKRPTRSEVDSCRTWHGRVEGVRGWGQGRGRRADHHGRNHFPQ
jgi:hypothetical protein